MDGIDKISKWQERLQRSEGAFDREVRKAKWREMVFEGDVEAYPPIYLENYETYFPVFPINRLIVKEIIDAKNIGGTLYPKVRAKRELDIERAKTIEDFLLSESYRLNLTEQELEKYRNGAVHGGFGQLVQWISDDAIPQSHSKLKVSPVYVQFEFVPQAGVFRSTEEMDYFFIKIAASKETIERVYDIEIKNDYSMSEHKPVYNDDIIEYYRCYYRNNGGGVGVFAWTGNQTVLEDYENYLERKMLVCDVCGNPALESAVTEDGERVPCEVCGSAAWKLGDAKEQTVYKNIIDSLGNVVVPGVQEITFTAFDTSGVEREFPVIGDNGEAELTDPIKIPFYVPKMYPFVLYRNTIVPNRVLGRSEADELAPYQNAINYLHMQIDEKLMTSGDVMTLPEREDMLITNRRRAYYIRQDEKALIDVKSLQGNVSSEFAYEDRLYQMARHQAGVTDSFQGRPDMSAESAIAKQLQVAQTEQRLRENIALREQSMRELYKRMFQTALAFADDNITYTQTLTTGETSEGVFCRYDFLEQLEDGSWHWIDDFEFDVTEEQPLKVNTTAQLQDLVSMFNMGVFSSQKPPEERARLGHALKKLGYQFADAILSGAEEDKNAAVNQQMMLQQSQQQIPQGREVAAPDGQPNALEQQQFTGGNASGF
ncbi:MAG: hypothetical protein LBJ84_06755 [Oscillospiraceae bacterium]|jgi:hypothetical protein|nr:hypothetical protein [Oscillospiraceae bacterium]